MPRFILILVALAGLSLAQRTAGQSKLFDSRGLTPGSYTIEVRVKDQVSGTSLIENAGFDVVP